MTRALLHLLGSTRAVLILIAICAAAMLLTACSGPSDTEALQDTAADLRDAQQQAQIDHHMALALLSARGHK